MIKQIEGIIISTVDYKESSKIINILSIEEGMVGVLAKGSKRIKSKIATTSNVLTYGIFYLKYNKGGMPLLLEVDVKNNFKYIRKDFLKMNYAIFLLELASQVYRHDAIRDIYDLLIEGLNKINDDYDSQIITNIIELKMLSYLGIKPVIDRCVNCQKTNDIITISSYKGGFLCKKCIGNEPVFNIKTLGLIRMLYYVDLSKINKIDINDDIKKEISTFIDDYYERYSGLYLKSKHLLETFKNV